MAFDALIKFRCDKALEDCVDRLVELSKPPEISFNDWKAAWLRAAMKEYCEAREAKLRKSSRPKKHGKRKRAVPKSSGEVAGPSSDN